MGPITRQYPELTPYQFASNRPIDGIDLDGLEYLSNIKSVWLLRGFKTISSEYTINSLEVRNQAVHNIVLKHPDESPKGRDGRSLYEKSENNPDPREVNDMVVEKRSSSSRAQARSNMEAATERKKGSGDIVGGLVELVKWSRTTWYNTVHSKELDLANTSISALNQADNLVRAAAANPTFPTNINTTSFKTDLVNFITDGTIPKGDAMYQMTINTWGRLLYNNEAEVSNGTMNFSPLSTVIKKVEQPGLSDTKIKLGFITETTGNPNPAVKLANDMIKDKKYTGPTAVIKKG